MIQPSIETVFPATKQENICSVLGKEQESHNHLLSTYDVLLCTSLNALCLSKLIVTEVLQGQHYTPLDGFRM